MESDGQTAGRFPNLSFVTNPTHHGDRQEGPFDAFTQTNGRKNFLPQHGFPAGQSGDIRLSQLRQSLKYLMRLKCSLQCAQQSLPNCLPRWTYTTGYVVGHQFLPDRRRSGLPDCVQSSPSGPIERVRRISSVLKPIIIGRTTPGNVMTS